VIQNDLMIQSAILLARLNGLGFDIRADDDFERIMNRVRETGKTSLTPMFALNRNDFTKGSAFWAFLTKDKARVGGVAARYYDLNGEGLDSYLKRTSNAQYGDHREVIQSVAPPVALTIKGRLVYFGELQFARETRGNPRVLAAFARLSMILAAMTWPDFDWMYAFVAKEHTRLAEIYGFTYRLPRAITWNEPVPAGRLDTHVLAAISASDFAHLLATGELSEL